MIRVVLPAHLRTLARVAGDVEIQVEGPVTQGSVLDALEARYPALQGAIRHHATKQRRPFVRFFACQQDLSHESPDAPLPEQVVKGEEPFLVIGAIAGGSSPTPAPKARLWASRILSWFAALFLLADAAMKLVRAEASVQGTIELGYPEDTVVPIGIVLLVCTILYVIPRTAILGAVLLTGYLGGAVATHVRVAAPLFSNTLFPIYAAMLIWGGLYLRDPRARALISTNR